MCILGAVFVEDVVVQPLTEFIWTGNPANDGLKSVARCFNALCSGIQTLQTFYSELKLTRMPNGQRMFPFPCSYLDSQNHTVDFQYTGRLSDTKLVYLAKNKANGEILCVKFVQQYNVTAHKLLAKIALAPQLLHCSEVANGQFRMVVMDFVEGETAYERFGATQKVADPIVEQVKRAIDELHQNPLVFGDLRRPNVVIMKDGKAKLVDFDWCGEDGKGRYPPTLNDPSSINWHADVKRDGIMSKVHDEHMIATF